MKVVTWSVECVLNVSLQFFQIQRDITILGGLTVLAYVITLIVYQAGALLGLGTG